MTNRPVPAMPPKQQRKELTMSNLCKHDWVGDDHCAYCHAEELEQQIADLTRERDEARAAVQQIKHCDNCGGSWVDDGINSGCSCDRIAALEAELATLECDAAEAAKDKP
jgi:uncharacterized small protein (DUF1192 family)